MIKIIMNQPFQKSFNSFFMFFILVIVALVAFKVSVKNIASVDSFINESASQVYGSEKLKSAGVLQNLNICRKEDFSCYGNYYQALIKNGGVSVAFDDLKIRYHQNAYVKTMCHSIAHIIGNEAQEKYPTVSEAYQQGDSFCWSWYYHGILEAIISKIGEQEVKNHLNDLCAEIKDKEKYSFNYYNCVHGIGHGLMALGNEELFEALSLCDTLSGEWEQSTCYSGVFMENIIVDSKNHFTKYLKPADPLYPCNDVNETYKRVCYLMQTSYMFKISDFDFSKVFELCSQVEKKYQPTCYQSLGRDASTYAREISKSEPLALARTKEFCQMGEQKNQQSDCIIGAVRDLISFHHQKTQANALCYYVDAEFQKTCFTAVKNYSVS